MIAADFAFHVNLAANKLSKLHDHGPGPGTARDKPDGTGMRGLGAKTGRPYSSTGLIKQTP
jgi:hypothetical protein